MTSFIFQNFHPGSISVISSLRGQCRAMNQFCLAHTDLDLVYEYGKEKFATCEALSVMQCGKYRHWDLKHRFTVV